MEVMGNSTGKRAVAMLKAGVVGIGVDGVVAVEVGTEAAGLSIAGTLTSKMVAVSGNTLLDGVS